MKLSAADAIELLVKRAPELRTAGVLTLVVDGIHATLAPADPPVIEAPKAKRAAGDDEDEDHDEHYDPLEDPATYVGGRVPRRKRPVDDPPPATR